MATTPEDHEPGCVLDPVHWLRHAIAACERAMTGDGENVNADRLAATSLLNGLEHFATEDGWRGTTLLEVVRYSSLMGEKFAGMCTCGRGARTAS